MQTRAPKCSGSSSNKKIHFPTGPHIHCGPVFVLQHQQKRIALKKIILTLALICVTLGISAQFELIKTGRPQPFEYNNAAKTVGKKWGITFDYVAFDGVNFDLLDSINARNEATEQKLAARYGADWTIAFRKEVDAELARQNRLRQMIYELPGDKPAMIYLEQSRWNTNKYKAFAFAQVEKDGKRPFYIQQEYKLNLKSGKVKLKSSRMKPIHFESPENGITR